MTVAACELQLLPRRWTCGQLLGSGHVTLHTGRRAEETSHTFILHWQERSGSRRAASCPAALSSLCASTKPTSWSGSGASGSGLWSGVWTEPFCCLSGEWTTQFSPRSWGGAAHWAAAAAAAASHVPLTLTQLQTDTSESTHNLWGCSEWDSYMSFISDPPWCCVKTTSCITAEYQMCALGP